MNDCKYCTMAIIPLDLPVTKEFLCLLCIRGFPSPTRNNFRLEDTSPVATTVCRRRSHQNSCLQTSHTVTDKPSKLYVGCWAASQARYEFSHVDSFLLRALQFHFCMNSIPPCRAMLLPAEGGFVDMTPFCTCS